ncbi:MAG: hypothetical protein IT379_26245, partial [Deltaproteobacteria bacterium]|nr:hypothetical protein [Deltaproteobacteria bacterium]
MRRGLRAAGVTVGLLLAPAPAALVEAPATAQGVAAAPTLRDQLTQDALWREAFARRELWTWTTAEQVAALRTDPRLLSRTESPTRGVSAFDQRVREHMARTSSPISRLLSAPGLARRRFAWTAPW